MCAYPTYYFQSGTFGAKYLAFNHLEQNKLEKQQHKIFIQAEIKDEYSDHTLHHFFMEVSAPITSLAGLAMCRQQQRHANGPNGQTGIIDLLLPTSVAMVTKSGHADKDRSGLTNDR